MENKKELEVSDLRVIFKKIWSRRKLFYKVLPITFVLSCAYILCIPRTYTSSLSLAPEMSNSAGMGGTLGSLASSFGIDLGNIETTDAINPMLYPDLMDDNGFVVGLFGIKVKSLDGEISCNYFDFSWNNQRDQPPTLPCETLPPQTSIQTCSTTLPNHQSEKVCFHERTDVVVYRTISLSK